MNSRGSGVNVHVGVAGALTVNFSVMYFVPPLVVDTDSMPVYEPAVSPTTGRTLTVEELPPDIESEGFEVIVKYGFPNVKLALTPVNVTDPVLLIVAALVAGVKYPSV